MCWPCEVAQEIEERGRKMSINAWVQVCLDTPTRGVTSLVCVLAQPVVAANRHTLSCWIYWRLREAHLERSHGVIFIEQMRNGTSHLLFHGQILQTVIFQLGMHRDHSIVERSRSRKHLFTGQKCFRGFPSESSFGLSITAMCSPQMSLHFFFFFFEEMSCFPRTETCFCWDENSSSFKIKIVLFQDNVQYVVGCGLILNEMKLWWEVLNDIEWCGMIGINIG